MHFDVRAAKLLKPGEHLVVGGCPGLRLEVSVSRKTWTYRYKAPDGRMKQVAIGQWPAMAVQAAAAEWQAMRETRGGGEVPTSKRKAAKRVAPLEVRVAYTVRLLVADFIAGHLEHSRKPDGLNAARSALNRLLAESPGFADKDAEAINRSDAFAVLDAKKATPTAAQKLRSLLGSAWEYALDSGRLDGDAPNWWRAVMKGRLKSKGKIIGGKHVGQQRRVLSAAEISMLLRWLANMHVLGRDATTMYLWTCARGSEILALRPENVRREGDTWWWTIPKEQTKNARYEDAVDLRVPLFGRALEIVQRRIEGIGVSGWLFEDVRREQYVQKDFSTYIYSLQPYSEKVHRRESAGLVIPVTGWTPHNLRRTGRTLLAALGCPNEVGEAIIGHMPAEIVGTYNAYSYDAERKKWLCALSDHLEVLAQAGLPALP